MSHALKPPPNWLALGFIVSVSHLHLHSIFFPVHSPLYFCVTIVMSIKNMSIARQALNVRPLSWNESPLFYFFGFSFVFISWLICFTCTVTSNHCTSNNNNNKNTNVDNNRVALWQINIALCKESKWIDRKPQALHISN